MPIFMQFGEHWEVTHNINVVQLVHIYSSKIASESS